MADLVKDLYLGLLGNWACARDLITCVLVSQVSHGFPQISLTTMVKGNEEYLRKRFNTWRKLIVYNFFGTLVWILYMHMYAKFSNLTNYLAWLLKVVYLNKGLKFLQFSKSLVVNNNNIMHMLMYYEKTFDLIKHGKCWEFKGNYLCAKHLSRLETPGFRGIACLSQPLYPWEHSIW